MTILTPFLINEVESDRRGIKDGWYAINGVGKLGCGPFGNREDCLSSINRQSASIDAYHRWGDMPERHQRLQPMSIEKQVCPRCRGRMTLSSIQPERPSVDSGIFKCSNCLHVETVLVKAH